MARQVEPEAIVEYVADDHPAVLGNPLNVDLNVYLAFINLVPETVRDAIDKYEHPLTGKRRQFRYDNYQVLAEIVFVAEQMGQPPTRSVFEDHGAVSIQLYTDRFGSYPRAMELAGLDPVFESEYQEARYHASYEPILPAERERQ